MATRTNSTGFCCRIVAAICTVGVAAVLSACVASPDRHVRNAATGAVETFTVRAQDGVPISYRVAGRGELALVLVHGWSCDSSHWSSQLDSLSDRYTVVALDLAGHGASGANRGDWSIANYAADVRAVVEQVSSEKIVLVGHSMGGAVALEAAALIPERVIGVVGVDTFHRIGQPIPEDAEIERRAAAFRTDYQQMVASMAGAWFGPRASAELKAQITAQLARSSAQVAIPSMISFARVDYAHVLGRVRVPVNAINSDRLPLDVERIRQLAPQFELRLMPGTGHFVMLEDPREFERLLEETIQKMRDRSGRGPIASRE